jgi:hypothetical protein
MVTADDARTLRSNKGVVNHQTYKMIYERIQHRIQYAARKGYTQTDYTIPPIVPGRPMFDVSHAVRYTRDKLRYNGFRVTEIEEDVLRIDWKPDRGTFVPNKAATVAPSAASSTPTPILVNKPVAPSSRSKKSQKKTKEIPPGKLLETLQNLKSKLNMK